MFRWRRPGKWLGATGAALFVVAMLLAVPSFACSPTATIDVRPARAEAGTVVTVTGNNFDPGVIRLFFDGVLLTELAAAPDRTFSVQVAVPAGAQPGAHQFLATVRSQSDGRFYSAPREFTVPGAVPSTGGQPQAGGPQAPGQPAPGGQPAGGRQGAATPQPAQAAAGAAAAAPSGPGAPAGEVQAPGGQPVAAPGPQSGGVVPGAPSAGPSQALPAQDVLPPDAGVVHSGTDVSPASRGRRGADVGLSAWLLLPLALLGLALFSLSSASFLQELRQRRKVRVRA